MSAPDSTHTPKPGQLEWQEKASRIRLLVFDVDGVLTDGGMYYGPQGEALKRFDVKDGHGLVLARLLGLKVALLTARTSDIVALRARELGITTVLQGQKDKRAGMAQLLDMLQASPEQVAYMGDDVNDLAPLSMVGLPACPLDAVLEVRQKALFVSSRPGGHGAARELLEAVFKASGRWEKALALMRHEA